jgi:hypothetical protein
MSSLDVLRPTWEIGRRRFVGTDTLLFQGAAGLRENRPVQDTPGLLFQPWIKGVPQAISQEVKG